MKSCFIKAPFNKVPGENQFIWEGGVKEQTFAKQPRQPKLSYFTIRGSKSSSQACQGNQSHQHWDQVEQSQESDGGDEMENGAWVERNQEAENISDFHS